MLDFDNQEFSKAFDTELGTVSGINVLPIQNKAAVLQNLETYGNFDGGQGISTDEYTGILTNIGTPNDYWYDKASNDANAASGPAKTNFSAPAFRDFAKSFNTENGTPTLDDTEFSPSLLSELQRQWVDAGYYDKNATFSDGLVDAEGNLITPRFTTEGTVIRYDLPQQ